VPEKIGSCDFVRITFLILAFLYQGNDTIVIATDILQSEKSYIGHLVPSIAFHRIAEKNVCSFRQVCEATCCSNCQRFDAKFGSVALY